MGLKEVVFLGCGLPQDKDQWRALVNVVINILVP
jgi:hypothetical protein